MLYLQVLLARQKADNQTYAVKVLQKAAIMKRNEVKHIMAERNVLLKNVIHPFLVGLHYSFQTADKLYFVLDYVNGGEVSMGPGVTHRPRVSTQGRVVAAHLPPLSIVCGLSW